MEIPNKNIVKLIRNREYGFYHSAKRHKQNCYENRSALLPAFERKIDEMANRYNVTHQIDNVNESEFAYVLPYKFCKNVTDWRLEVIKFLKKKYPSISGWSGAEVQLNGLFGSTDFMHFMLRSKRLCNASTTLGNKFTLLPDLSMIGMINDYRFKFDKTAVLVLEGDFGTTIVHMGSPNSYFIKCLRHKQLYFDFFVSRFQNHTPEVGKIINKPICNCCLPIIEPYKVYEGAEETPFGDQVTVAVDQVAVVALGLNICNFNFQMIELINSSLYTDDGPYTDEDSSNDENMSVLSSDFSDSDE